MKCHDIAGTRQHEKWFTQLHKYTKGTMQGHGMISLTHYYWYHSPNRVNVRVLQYRAPYEETLQNRLLVTQVLECMWPVSWKRKMSIHTQYLQFCILLLVQRTIKDKTRFMGKSWAKLIWKESIQYNLIAKKPIYFYI